MKTQLISVDDHGVTYNALMFVCPGCKAAGGPDYSGLHMLPVNSAHIDKPSWRWNGDLENPTLSPSILTRGHPLGKDGVCHSFLKDGVFEFLTDSTHELSGQNVEIPDLPEWSLRDNG